MIDLIDPTKDFFELYPAYRLEFPKTESTRMWSYVLFLHPKSIYYNSTIMEKTILIRDIMPDQEFNPEVDEQKAEMTKLTSLILSKKRKYLIPIEKKIEQRNEFLDQTPYNEDTYEMCDKILLGSDKIDKMYLSLLALVEGEESSLEGGEPESLSDSGLI